MVNTGTQSWTPGSTVKVGFLSLIVRDSRPTPGDYAPDAYLLSDEGRTRYYEFVPHRGLARLDAWSLRTTWGVAQ